MRHALLLFAAGCIAAATSVVTAQAADTVKIGILWPFTGNAAAAGQAAKAAVEVALDIINNPHPELGDLPLAATAGPAQSRAAPSSRSIFVDHEGNPATAQQLATRLITQDKVDALMGAYQSSCTFTATAVAERYGVPFMVGESVGAQHHHPRLQMDVPLHADRYGLRTHLYALLRRHEKSGQEDRLDRHRQ